MILEVLQNSQENTWASASFLIKLKAFPVNFAKFLRTPFLQTTSCGCFCFLFSIFYLMQLLVILAGNSTHPHTSVQPGWKTLKWTSSYYFSRICRNFQIRQENLNQNRISKCDQVRVMRKNGWLSELELEAIKRWIPG